MTPLTTIRTAILSIALAGIALGALPAQAAPALGDTLALDFGITQPMVEQGRQLQTQMKQFGYDDHDVDDWCLSNKKIRRGLIMANFDEIDFEDSLKQHRVRIEALYVADGWVYSMQVDRCTGELSVIKPIYLAADLD